MADIRIKDLATTASSTASDDFLAVDGSANGTRKLNAFSPTFGGNVVATGTLTVNSTTDSSSKDTGAIVTEGGLGVEKSATIGGNLTVSGTGTSSFSGILSEKTAAMTNPVLIGEMSDSTTVGVVSFSDSRTSSAMLGIAGTTTDLFLAVPSTGTFQFRNGWTEQMRLFANGNLFIGASPVDSSNGKLQLATHTTSAGGIGFGTDTSLYRSGTGVLQLDGSNVARLTMKDVAANLATYIASDGGNLYIGVTDTPSPSNDAIVLDAAKNVAFAGGASVAGSILQTGSNRVRIEGTAANTVSNASGAGIELFNAGILAFNRSTAAYSALGFAGSEITFDSGTSNGRALTLDTSKNATFAGSIAIGNTVNTVSPTSPNRTITMVIGGTTYYIHAKTTND